MSKTIEALKRCVEIATMGYKQKSWVIDALTELGGARSQLSNIREVLEYAKGNTRHWTCDIPTKLCPICQALKDITEGRK